MQFLNLFCCVAELCQQLLKNTFGARTARLNCESAPTVAGQRLAEGEPGLVAAGGRNICPGFWANARVDIQVLYRTAWP